LQGARRYLITACNTLLFLRIFLILHAVSNPLLHTAKGIRYLLDLKQKGQVTLSNNATSVFACALHEKILKTLSENRRKNLKIQKENVFVWIRAPAAILPAESANCMCKLQYRWDNLN
jgi:hypothetical protein